MELRDKPPVKRSAPAEQSISGSHGTDSAPSFPEGLADNLFKLFCDLLFCESEIENVFGPAVGTRMSLRITIKEDYIKFLCALVAIDRFFYGENRFHLVVTDLINLEHCSGPAGHHAEYPRFNSK